MENPKFGSNDTSRRGSTNKSNVLQERKTFDNLNSSFKKIKNNKSGVSKNHITHYVVQKRNKKNRSQKMSKNSLKQIKKNSELISYLSTPNQKSMESRWKNQFSKNKVQKLDQLCSKLLSPTKSQPINLKINFYLKNQKIFARTFSPKETISDIKHFVMKQIISHYNKKNQYCSLIGFVTINNIYLIDKILSLNRKTIADILDEGLKELSVKVLLTKKKPTYDNLELGNFQILKFIGNGGFSTVYLARCKVDGMMCALKLIRKSNVLSDKKQQMVDNEKNILFCIDHKRIIDLYYAIESQNFIIFGLQFCPNGNLFEVLKRHKKLNEQLAKFVFYQILEGMKYLHSQNILFRDMKLQNILFDQNGNIRITDFGLSKPNFQENQITYSYCGSPEYMAPQMLAKSGHTLAVDYYALGILLYELLYGHSPFDSLKKQEIFYGIINQKPHFPNSPSLSKEVIQLISGLLQKNPRHRIGTLKGISEILSHPWLRNYTLPQKSPFKVEACDQEVKINEEKQKKIICQLQKDLSMEKFTKVFFPKSLINRNIMERFVQNYQPFGKQTSNQKGK